MARGHDSDGRRTWDESPWVLWGSLALLGAALFALVTVPPLLSGRTEALRTRIATLEIGERTLGLLGLSQSAEMASIERYVDTGDPEDRTNFREDRAREDSYIRQLGSGAEPLSRAYSRQWLEFFNATQEWHIHHADVMGVGFGSMDFEAFAGQITDERELYDAVGSAWRRLSIAHEQELLRAVRDAASQDDITTGVSFALMVAALMGIMGIGVLARALRKLARQEELRRRDAVDARREVQAVLRATADGVMGVDPDGRCTFLNEAGARMLGCTAREMKGRRVHETVLHTAADGTPAPRGTTPLALALSAGETVVAPDTVAWRQDGSSVPVRMTATPIMESGTVRGAVLTLTDMTDVREAEAALRSAVEVRDEVMAVVSHDLRNPVGTISAASELLLEIPVPEERRREHLQAIHRSAERMGALIRDMLDVARIEAGRFIVNPEDVEVPEMLDEVAVIMSRIARERHVSVRVDAEEGLMPVRADRDRIIQVLENLVSNAVRFTPKWGTVHVTAQLEGDEVVLSVSDEGPGISEEDRVRVFDRFWKASRKEGAGLGLAIVKGIVEAHGGVVSVESTPGEGARFSFGLPQVVPSPLQSSNVST